MARLDSLQHNYEGSIEKFKKLSQTILTKIRETSTLAEKKTLSDKRSSVQNAVKIVLNIQKMVKGLKESPPAFLTGRTSVHLSWQKGSLSPLTSVPIGKRSQTKHWIPTRANKSKRQDSNLPVKASKPIETDTTSSSQTKEAKKRKLGVVRPMYAPPGKRGDTPVGESRGILKRTKVTIKKEKLDENQTAGGGTKEKEKSVKKRKGRGNFRRGMHG